MIAAHLDTYWREMWQRFDAKISFNMPHNGDNNVAMSHMLPRRHVALIRHILGNIVKLIMTLLI